MRTLPVRCALSSMTAQIATLSRCAFFSVGSRASGAMDPAKPLRHAKAERVTKPVGPCLLLAQGGAICGRAGHCEPVACDPHWRLCAYAPMRFGVSRDAKTCGRVLFGSVPFRRKHPGISTRFTELTHCASSSSIVRASCPGTRGSGSLARFRLVGDGKVQPGTVRSNREIRALVHAVLSLEAEKIPVGSLRHDTDLMLCPVA